MKTYYVNSNAQANGDHEVHSEGCLYMPNYENRRFLGYFSNCQDAIRDAKKIYIKPNGCYHCCYQCHTS